jgi:hypothetical protein
MSKKEKTKAKQKVDEVREMCEFWLPLLNDFALNSGDGKYEHPWIPVEILRRIAAIVDDEAGKKRAKK